MAFPQVGFGWGSGAWDQGVWGQESIEVPLTTVAATGTLGALSVAAAARVDISGVSATTQLGVVTLPGVRTLAYTTGVEATTGLGSLAVYLNTPVVLTGVSATGALGVVWVWSMTQPGPDASWVTVPGGSNPGWVGVSSEPDASWVAVPGGSNPGWAGVSSGPGAGWNSVVT